jgi:hypothetical protein
MAYESREQKLVNLCFTFALMTKDYMMNKDREEIAAWVAHNLAECGFHTKPMGSSWGVLCEAPPEVNDGRITIYEPNRPD